VTGGGGGDDDGICGAMTLLFSSLRTNASECGNLLWCASHRFEDCFACVSNDTARNDGVGGMEKR